MAVLLFVSVLQGPFLYDDHAYVRENLLLRDPLGFLKAWTTPFPPARPEMGLYRPLTTLSFWLGERVHGLNPVGCHGMNALLHGGASGMLVLVVSRLGGGRLASGAAGLLFAAHPVHTEAVAWIVGRSEVLVGLFCFLSVLGWIRYRRQGGMGALIWTLAAWFAALASKESAAPLPAVFVLGDLLGIFKGPRRLGTRHPAWPYLGFLAVFLLYLTLRSQALEVHALVAQEARGELARNPGLSRLWASLGLLGAYVRLVLWPIGLKVHHPVPSLAHQILGFLSLLGAAWVSWHLRRSRPMATFWMGWFLVMVLPFTNLMVPTGSFIAERLMYTASAAICVGFGLVFQGLQARPAWRGPVWGTALVLILASAGLTLLRNRDWADEECFWRRERAAAPGILKPYLNLSRVVWQRGAREEAMELLRQAMALRDPGSKVITSDHLQAHLRYGKSLDSIGRAAEAVPYFDEVVRVSERHPALAREFLPDTYLSQAVALVAAGDRGKAIQAYEKALAQRPDWGGAWMNLGNLHHTEGRLEAAVECFRRAVTAEPTLGMAHANLSQTLADLGRMPEAELVFKGMLALADTPQHDLVVGVTAARLGQLDVARHRLKHALERAPGTPTAGQAARTLRSLEGRR